MKIFSGILKGMKLEAKEGLTTRPTGARVREAVFHVLQDRIEGARFLDLFAGSGAVGFEALSWGARACTFVEEDPGMVKYLRKAETEALRRYRAQSIGAPEISVLQKNALTLSPASLGTEYDVVWMDPPYAMWADRKILSQLVTLAVQTCTREGLMIFECAKKQSPALIETMKSEGAVLLREKAYGESSVLYFSKKET